MLSSTIIFVFKMFILKPLRLLSLHSSCSIISSSCGVSVHRKILSAKFSLLKILSNVDVNSLGEMVSPCRTPLLMFIFSLSL